MLVTDRDLVPVGDPIGEWTSIDSMLKFNEPASSTITLPASTAVLDQVNTDGGRIVLVRDKAIWSAGPIERTGPYTWSAAAGQSSGPGQLTVSWTDDLALIAGRLTYPDPTATETAQLVDFYELTATNAETAMRSLVDLNAGPSALTARRIPQLALGSVAGVGTSIDVRTRFEPVTDVLRSAALAGGGLGFRTQQVAGQILFSVYAPADRTGRIRYSRGLGNLRAFSYEPEAPTCTTAIVGGDGTGATRTIRSSSDSTATARWWRLERWVNQSSETSTTVMDQAAAEALASGAERAQLRAETVDTADQRYGVDYQLGDRVSVELYPGVTVTDVVRAVRLTASPDQGEVVTPLIGSSDATTDPRLVALYRSIERRLGRLERS